ncbi:hypothetical protein N7G274_001829 [Stereocaulon virgatum]|uniref:Uncharacterized protein n=1 Tax=Stereocaulon virgatum TaxID=373712 RepID=A0ABR4ANV2_9LECA
MKPASLCPTCREFYFRDLDKRIYQAIGLDLPTNYRRILARVNTRTLAQVPFQVSTKPYPLSTSSQYFIYFDIKWPNTDKDSLIQLGAFSATEFTKRRRKGYALNMPMLAVEVVGDLWRIYIVFATEDNNKNSYQRNFVGPLEMGTTNDTLAVFKILDTLCWCADWGIGPYRNWFLKEILAKYG